MKQQSNAAFAQATALTLEDIDAVVDRAREERAEAIRAGAVSLRLIVKHFMSERCLPLRA